MRLAYQSSSPRTMRPTVADSSFASSFSAKSRREYMRPDSTAADRPTFAKSAGLESRHSPPLGTVATVRRLGGLDAAAANDPAVVVARLTPALPIPNGRWRLIAGTAFPSAAASTGYSSKRAPTRNDVECFMAISNVLMLAWCQCPGQNNIKIIPAPQ